MCGGLSVWGRVTEGTPGKTATPWTPSSGQPPWVKPGPSNPHGTFEIHSVVGENEGRGLGTCQGLIAGEQRRGLWTPIQLIPHLWVSDSDSFKAAKPRSQLGALAEPLPTPQSGDEGWPPLPAFPL